MDPKLAEIYGTNEVTEADVEKLAAAELATKLAGDEETGTEGMTEEDLEAIAQQVLAPEQEQQEEVEETQAGDEAQEKVAEADYLGRVMAHSYVQELRNIEKTAGRGDGSGQEAEAVNEQVAKMNAKRAKYDKMGAEGPGMGAKLENKARSAKAGVGKVGKYIGAGFKGGATKGQRAAAIGTTVTGAAALAGGAKKVFGKGKEKKSEAEEQPEQMSAVDTLVMARANEILQASGIDPATLTKIEEQEKISADETVDAREVLANTVEQRAWELLGQYGVTPAEQETEQEQA